MAGIHGTPRTCLVIDTEELPVPYTRDLPDRPMVPMITVRLLRMSGPSRVLTRKYARVR